MPRVYKLQTLLTTSKNGNPVDCTKELCFFLSMINISHFQISSLGTFFPLSIKFDDLKIYEQLGHFKTDWHMYNPRKEDCRRFGLSLFSLDGQMIGVPNLDSLKEYNIENKTHFDETSFSEPTKAWTGIPEISQKLDSITNFLVRSHFINIRKGGFFPPHRDLGQSFRLIAFFRCSPISCHLVVDNKLMSFSPNRLYFLDTHKSHSLVSFDDDTMILVLNVIYDEKAIDFVLSNLVER